MEGEAEIEEISRMTPLSSPDRNNEPFSPDTSDAIESKSEHRERERTETKTEEPELSSIPALFAQTLKETVAALVPAVAPPPAGTSRTRCLDTHAMS